MVIEYRSQNNFTQTFFFFLPKGKFVNGQVIEQFSPTITLHSGPAQFPTHLRKQRVLQRLPNLALQGRVETKVGRKEVGLVSTSLG